MVLVWGNFKTIKTIGTIRTYSLVFHVIIVLLVPIVLYVPLIMFQSPSFGYNLLVEFDRIAINR